MKSRLVIDSMYLCYRALYSTGFMSHNGHSTGVAFGFLREIRNLMEIHNTEDIVFTFDYGEPFRKNTYPAYKEGRVDNLTPEQRQAFRKEVRQLRDKHLTAIGFKNIWYCEGYEADDLIAAAVTGWRMKGVVGAIIVSSDKDLYQLLDTDVCIWLPSKNRMVTLDSFKKEYGIDPTEWPVLKAIAGCKTDNIKGVDGVGEKTAAKYLSHSLGAGCQAWKNIKKHRPLWKKNLQLVRLPWPGTPTYDIKEDKVSEKNWKQVLDSLGIKSLKVKEKAEGFGIK